MDSQLYRLLKGVNQTCRSWPNHICTTCVW